MSFRNLGATSIFTIILMTDFASAGMALAISGEDGIDATRLPVCMALPGTGGVMAQIFPTNRAAAELLSDNDQSCGAVMKRAGFEIG